jgi:hypothetical protein
LFAHNPAAHFIPAGFIIRHSKKADEWPTGQQYEYDDEAREQMLYSTLIYFLLWNRALKKESLRKSFP